MTPEQFCYFIAGLIELNESYPTPEQWAVINKKLEIVLHDLHERY